MTLISRKSRYALHGLAYMATFPAGEPVPFAQILGYLRAYSPRLSLSHGYLAKVFQDVSRAGFATAMVGPHGGYQLARPADAISLIEVIEALDGPQLSDCCLLSMGDCPNQSTCGVRSLLGEAELTFYRFFQEHTVASLAARMDFPDAAAIRANTIEPRRHHP